MATDQTVFVIDDDQAVRESISALLDIRGLPVKAYACAEDFLEAFDIDTPGCVVTDLRIESGMSGIELQTELQKRQSSIPVVVISAYANVSNAVEAMHNGAVTLLEKNCSTSELWTAITDALAQDRSLRAMRGRVDELLERFRELTPDEIAVMTRIVAGMLNKVIARDLSISLRTVETRRHNLLRKLDVATVPELVRLYVEVEKAIGSPPEDVLLKNDDPARGEE